MNRTRRRIVRGAVITLAAALVAGGVAVIGAPAANADSVFTLGVTSAAGSSLDALTVGDTLTVTLDASGVDDLYAYSVELDYPSRKLAYVGDSATTDVSGYGEADSTTANGTTATTFTHTKLGTSPSTSGQVRLVTLQFTVLHGGDAPLDVAHVEFVDSKRSASDWAGAASQALHAAASDTTGLALAVSAASVAHGATSPTATATLTGATEGAIAFAVDGADIGSIAVDDAGTASIALPTGLAVGAHSVAANYLGSDEALGSSSSASYEITPTATSTTLALSSPSLARGTAATATATVTGVDGTLDAGGVVEFRMDGATSGTLVPVTDGTATFAIPADLAAGSHTVTAELRPTATSSGSSSSAAFAVGKSATTTSLTLSPSSVPYGKGTVAATARVSGVTSGSVTFAVDGKTVATAKVSAGVAKATIRTTYRVGTHTVTATLAAAPDTTASSASTHLSIRSAHLSSMSAKTTTRSIKAGKRAKVVVTLGALENGKKPTGAVQAVIAGKVVKTATVTTSSKGRVTITLPTLRRSTAVTLRYTGSSTTSAKSTKVTVRVTR